MPGAVAQLALRCDQRSARIDDDVAAEGGAGARAALDAGAQALVEAGPQQVVLMQDVHPVAARALHAGVPVAADADALRLAEPGDALARAGRDAVARIHALRGVVDQRDLHRRRPGILREHRGEHLAQELGIGLVGRDHHRPERPRRPIRDRRDWRVRVHRRPVPPKSRRGSYQRLHPMALPLRAFAPLRLRVERSAEFPPLRINPSYYRMSERPVDGTARICIAVMITLRQMRRLPAEPQHANDQNAPPDRDRARRTARRVR